MRPTPLLMIASTILLTFGCAKDKESVPAPPERVQHPVLVGTLTENGLKLVNGKYRAACDDAIEPARQKLLNALEARSKKIAAFYPPPTSSPSSFQSVSFGPTHARERIKPITAPAGWQEDVSSWATAVAIHERIQNEPVNQDWIALDAFVKGMLVDDLARVRGVNYQTDKDSKPKFEALLQELNACKANEDCVEPTLTPETKAFLASQLSYTDLHKLIMGNGDKETRRKALDSLISWAQVDYDFYFKFHKNPLVSRVADDKYLLPLDLGDFASASEQMQKYFTDVWSADPKSVSLSVKEPNSSPELFKVLLGTEQYGRSWMSRKVLTVTLNPGLRSKTVAHELGHVLGFPDSYFTVWNPENCEWKSQYNPSDLMSSSDTGGVLDIHWATLSQEYQQKK